MTFDTTTLVVYSFFLITPILSFLLPSTGLTLVQIAGLFIIQAVVAFLYVNPLFGAIVWLVYVGAVSVLFLVVVTTLSPNQWRVAHYSTGDMQNEIIVVCAVASAMFQMFNEVVWLVKQLNSITYYSNVIKHTKGGVNFSTLNDVMTQNLGFMNNKILFLTCGVLLVIGMYVVIQSTITTPESIKRWWLSNKRY